MPLSRTVLERQIDQAKSELSAWIGQLAKNGVERTDFRKNAKWRSLNSKYNQVQRRLDSLTKVEANNADVAKRKAEKAAAAAAPPVAAKPAPEAKKAKPPKDKAPKEKAPKAKPE